MVELAADAARDVDVHPIEDAAAGVGVSVEAEVEQVAQEAAALGDAVADHALDRLLPIAQEAGGVAEGEQAGADNRRALGAVRHLVDAARLEAAVEQDVVGAGPLNAVGAELGEAPLLARDLGRLLILVVAHVETRGRVIGVGGGVAGLAEVADRPGSGALVGADIGRGVAVQIALGFGRIEPEQARQGGRVPLPGDFGDREAVAHQEAVAGVQRVHHRPRPRGAIEDAGCDRSAPVGHVDEQRAVGAGRVGWEQQHEVAGEAHTAVAAARRELQVVDRLAVRGLRVDGVMQPGADQVVGAGVAERLSIGIGGSFNNFDALD